MPHEFRTKSIVSLLLALCILLGGAAAVEAKGILYFLRDAGTPGNDLTTLSLVDGSLTVVGPTSVNGSTVGLTTSGNPALLYGTQPFGILHIDADGSGDSAFGTDGWEGLAYDEDTGTLYGGGIPGFNGFATINPATGAIIANLTDNPFEDDIEGLAFGNGGVYALAQTDSNLYFYNVGSTSWSIIGDTGITWSNSGLAYDPTEDLLYAKGFGDTNLYSLNPATGAPTTIGSTGTDRGGGLAFVVIPEPGSATLMLLAGLSAWLLFCRRFR